MIDLTYTYICPICGKKQEVKHSISTGSAPPRPCIPGGWHLFDGGIICDKHEIKIIDKDGDTNA